MTRHFLLRDFIVPVYGSTGSTMQLGGGSRAERRARLAEFGRGDLANYRVARYDRHTRLSVVFIDLRRGKFLISAGNIESAFRAARAVDAVFTLYRGHSAEPDPVLPKLLEVRHVPAQGWSMDDLEAELACASLPTFDVSSVVRYLFDGTSVEPEQMRLVGPFAEIFYSKAHLSDAAYHLAMSRLVVNGYMSGSYYHAHYRRQRERMGKRMLKRDYLEHREQYELSFAAAFKGLERFLQTSQIKEQTIDTLLRSRSDPETSPEKHFRRYFERYTGQPRHTTLREMISRFLLMRNAAAAHGNVSPPLHLCISHEAVFELQKLLEELLKLALRDVESRPLPRGAVLRGSWPSTN